MKHKTKLLGLTTSLVTGPVDVIGDVHGCLDELLELLARLGWVRDEEGRLAHLDPPTLLFVGDLINRGPRSLEVLELVAALVQRGHARLVLGNHDFKAARWLADSSESRPEIARLLGELPRSERKAMRVRARALFASASHWITCDGMIIVHASWHPRFVELEPLRAQRLALYGPRLRFSGSPVKIRLDWRLAYPPTAPLCVFGHAAYAGPPVITSNTLCIDTACVYGGRLTALRWPSGEIVSVPAHRAHCAHGDLQAKPPLLDQGPDFLRDAGWVKG